MMNTNPFDLFSKPNWPKGTGGRPRPKPAPAPETEEDIPPLQSEKSEPVQANPRVILSNLRWSAEGGEFNDKISVQADASVPDELKHLTRVEFKLFALTSEGKRESIDKQDGHLKEGTASADVTLYWPQYRKDGNLLPECDFLFTAKHRESNEEESPILKVTGPKEPFGKIWVKLIDRRGQPLSGLECELKGKKQPFPKKELDESGCVIWEEIPLEEYWIEFKSGSGIRQQFIPWLAMDADLHVQRVR